MIITSRPHLMNRYLENQLVIRFVFPFFVEEDETSLNHVLKPSNLFEEEVPNG